MQVLLCRDHLSWCWFTSPTSSAFAKALSKQFYVYMLGVKSFCSNSSIIKYASSVQPTVPKPSMRLQYVTTLNSIPRSLAYSKTTCALSSLSDFSKPVYHRFTRFPPYPTCIIFFSSWYALSTLPNLQNLPDDLIVSKHSQSTTLILPRIKHHFHSDCVTCLS